MTTTEERLLTLESETAGLRQRLARLEGAAPPPAAAPVPAARPAPPPRPAKLPRQRPAVNWEELLGRRLLALAGGAAVLVGLAFFVAVAVQRGWIGEPARVVAAALAASALLAGGAWLYERRGRLQAALALVGVGIAGLYLTLAVATSLYELVPTLLALPAALAIGGTATALAVRWNTRTVAGLGIGGALLSPALADLSSTTAVLFLALAFGASAAVLVWRRWPWLAVGAFLVTAPQLLVWLALAQRPSDALIAGVLSLFAGLNLVAALGHELRARSGRLHASTTLLAVAGAATFGGLGYVGLGDGELWLAGLAAAHAVLGGLALASRRIGNELAFVLLAIALTLGDVGFAQLASGPVLAVGWAASAAVLAMALRRLTRSAELLELTLGSQLALAAVHTLLFDAHVSTLRDGTVELGAAVPPLAAIAIAAFGCARLTVRETPRARRALDALSLAALVLVDFAVLHGSALVVAFALEAMALHMLGRRLSDDVARLGALVLLALAAGKALDVARPESLLHGFPHLTAAAIALGIVAATATRLRLPPVAAVSVLYLASIAIVTPFGGDQRGQVLLSVCWSACGLAVLWLGLRRDARALRFTGFGLLALAVGKVFLYDLAATSSVYRVLSCVALGLLLLASAYAYQRLRPPETGAPAAS